MSFINALKGEVTFSTDKGKLEKGYNTITKLGNAYFSYNAKTFFDMIRAVEKNHMFMQSAIIYNESATLKTRDKNAQFCVYLLNLGTEELAALSSANTMLPIYNSGSCVIDTTKIVGWGSFFRTSTATKMGILKDCASATNANDDKQSIAWTWAAGLATGTFNCIALGVNTNVETKDRFNGLALWKGLSNNDVYGGNNAALPNYCIPGISGITSASEILLAGNATTAVAKIKRDMITGAETQLQSGDDAFDFPLPGYTHGAQLVYGTRYFYHKSNKIWVYDTVAKTHEDTGMSTYYGDNFYPCSLFIYNGRIYVSSGLENLAAYNLTTYVAESTYDLTYTALNLPTDFGASPSLLSVTVRNYGNSGNFIASVWDEVLVQEKSAGTTQRKSIIVSDPTNCATTIVSILPMITTCNACTVNGEMILFNGSVRDDIMQTVDMHPTTPTTLTLGTGVMFSRLWTGNMLAFKTYSSPQTIASDETANVEYGFVYGNT